MLKTLLTPRTIGRTILLVLSVVLFALILVLGHTLQARAAAGYQLTQVYTTAWDSWWCTGTTGNCQFSCDASNVGRSCTTQTCLNNYQTAPDGSMGNIWVVNYTCMSTAPTCTPDTSCAANTCSSGTCTATASDCSTYQVQGTQNCSVSCTATNSCGQSNTGVLSGGVCSVSAPSESGCPVGSCAPYNSGTPPNCYSTCQNLPDHEEGTWPYCFTPTTCTSPANSCGMTNSGTTVTYGGACSASTPSDSLCPVVPPGCTPDLSCKANTCTGSTCSDGCGNLLSGTKTCVVPPGTCTNPTVNITATPNRVNSGQPVTLSITGSGLNQSCTVTGTGSGSSMNQVLTPTSCNLNPNPTTIVTPPITTQSTFTVTCLDGPVGSTFVAASAAVIVNINPTFNPF